MKLEWEKIKEEKYKTGWRKVIKKTFKLPGGKIDDYDIKDEGTRAGIFALTKENKVILVNVFRPGVEKVLTEMPGGVVEIGEDPKDAAGRELLEETGFKGDLEFAGEVIDDAYSNCIASIFVAKNCVKVSEPKREEDEVMEIVEMSIDEFREHLRSGQLTDVELGYLALDYLKLL